MHLFVRINVRINGSLSKVTQLKKLSFLEKKTNHFLKENY